MESIFVIRKIILEYAAKRRTSLAKPLEDGFSEGFKLLSRKASDVNSVEISTTDYSPVINMKGYEGNWLERDLSATEKQHVGLSMLYAICKLSRKSLPVVVDTPCFQNGQRTQGLVCHQFLSKIIPSGHSSHH